jgi:hypothetical protein
LFAIHQSPEDRAEVIGNGESVVGAISFNCEHVELDVDAVQMSNIDKA